MSASSLRARDLMTEMVLTVPPGMPVSSLARMLSERGISSVPVTDASGHLLGIVTEADLLRRLAGAMDPSLSWLRSLIRNESQQAEQYARTHGVEARDVMTTKVVTVDPEATAERCAQLMEQHRIKRLPVLRDGQLVGIISRADLLAEVLERPPEKIGTEAQDRDARIRAALRTEMRDQPWTRSLYTFADVRDGVVTLSGYVRSDEVRRGLRVLAGRIAGVERVEDQMEVASFPLPGELV
ncbi:CBS domain-containing protein [Roseomonas xinghualingensis]|uniref:CBS domain-containing protein n=1 Tax=Roseomonas xinghualingensis TaxID=2986475 RepID=UPI0021F1A965|nr:CBS domain-containing protein [Roseomonas sp. SXEYE001]MCV4209630.1 CBS domain-containing protein [Roseomonas sp. SXEYE001]